MAYIGKSPVIGNFVKLDAITAVNGQAAYTMQNGGSNFTDYESVNQFLVSLNGTIQAPTDSFTVSGSTLTFASNLSTGDVIDFIMVFGNSLSAGTPTDATVTAAKLNNDIISGQTELAATPADTDELLISDAGTIKRIDFSYLKTGITMAYQWRLTSDYTGNADPISSNWEQVDTYSPGGIGSAMSESSGIFTFPETGIYYIEFNVSTQNGGTSEYITSQIQVTTDNSSYDTATTVYGNAYASSTFSNVNSQFIFDVTNTSTHKCRFKNVKQNASNITTRGDSSTNRTYVTFIRLGDT